MNAIRDLVRDAIVDGASLNDPSILQADLVNGDTIMVELSDGRTFALVVQPA